ncbi:hypothetical protein NG798_24255 [Ancylothrix sp. C2]|uniref:hypothetical protein n=1 Tax=Ancylothrix sp. D3o TaxID=2953691 RepID=UPI0021BA6C37|nr:hypothetical protein [Ancylothrix sp. D3o]MCT7952917.1 hypothetical protein [Ancylothrix sp. D3o]
MFVKKLNQLLILITGLQFAWKQIIIVFARLTPTPFAPPAASYQTNSPEPSAFMGFTIGQKKPPASNWHGHQLPSCMAG